MKYLLIFIIPVFISCTKRYDVKYENGIHYAEDVYSEIERVYEVPWKVGLKRESEVSQGLRFFTSVPLLTDNAKKILVSKYGVDSWVYRFRRIRRGSTQSLGHFYVMFQNITRNTKNLSVSLFYQAAAVSKKFRFFHCPAFNHRYKIASFSNKSRPDAKKKNLFLRSIETIKARTTRFKFAPMIMPGGISLIGKYVIEMAFYNSRTKQRYSEWFPVDGVISVDQETAKVVGSCAGIKEEVSPLPQSRVPDIRDFEIR